MLFPNSYVSRKCSALSICALPLVSPQSPARIIIFATEAKLKDAVPINLQKVF